MDTAAEGAGACTGDGVEGSLKEGSLMIFVATVGSPPAIFHAALTFASSNSGNVKRNLLNLARSASDTELGSDDCREWATGRVPRTIRVVPTLTLSEVDSSEERDA